MSLLARGFSTLRFRLALVVLLAVAPAIVVVIISANQEIHDLKDRATDDCLTVVRLAAAQQEQLIESARQLLVTIAEFPAVRNGEVNHCGEIVARIQSCHPQYANIAVTRADGENWASAVPLKKPVNTSDRSWFRRAMQTKAFAVGEYQVGRITGKPTINMAYPVLDATGQIQQVVYLALDTGWLNQWIGRTKLPEGAVLTVIDRRGTVLARTLDAPKWIGQTLPEQPLVATILSKQEGVREVMGLDGVTRLYAFSAVMLGAEGWFVSVGIPTDVVYAGVRQRLHRDLLVIVAVALAALAATWVLGNAFVARPVRLLEAAARQLEAGDLQARATTTRGGGELNHLSRSFNTMAAALQARIAERDRAEQELRQLNTELERRVRLRTAEVERYFALSLDLMCIAGFDGYFKKLNKAWERMLGWSEQELLGKPFMDFVHPDDREATVAAAKQLTEGKDVVAFENRYLCRDGSYRWFLWESTPLVDEKLIYAVAHDYTRRKQAEESMVAANKELEAFAYSVSHDLRAPLRAINGFSQILLEDCADQLDESGREHLQEVRAASVRMGELIDDLLNLSRITRTEMTRQPVDLSSLARDVVAELQKQNPTRQVQVAITDGLTTVGDPRLLRIMLVNLIGNAWKFTSKTPKSQIEMGRTIKDSHATFFIRDNGAGFDMTYANKLFGVFQRLHSMTEFEGTGIGLAIVQRVIQRHGGRVWAEGKVNEGATFYFNL